MLLLAASLFFAEPAPLEMPRATAFLERRTDGRCRLVDRYDVTDLWTSRAVTGRWTDGDGRVFTLAELAYLPPAVNASETVTRAEYVAVPADPRQPRHLFACVDALSPVVPVAEGVRPHQLPRGYRDVRYFQGTNQSVIVCAYWPEGAAAWRLAVWELGEGDVFAERLERFEDAFLADEARELREPRRDVRAARAADEPSERDLLRADVRHGVAAYAAWHFTDGGAFAVVDDLPSRAFVARMTNGLAEARAEYAAAIPSPVDGSNTLSVARVYATREEYLEALDVNGTADALSWTAAYWSPRRRELVAYLPADGEEALLKTLRHESFHQYLSYACSMIESSPWFNEGYAEYFEDPERTDFGEPLTDERLDACAERLPALLELDYEAFYAGTDEDRKLKYRLAWSVARFIEKGAGEVRFRPFADLKRDYIKALLETRDMRRATAAAFGSADKLALFVAEWKKYWKGCP